MQKRNLTLMPGLVAATLLSASGCIGSSEPDVDIIAGGGTGDREILHGIFLDEAVDGLAYQTATQTNFTSGGGIFAYIAGETITFSIGTIVLGSAAAGPILTPQDLAAVPATLNETVTNIARLLQSLDEDQDPSNGITISSATNGAAAGLTVDFAVSTAVFESNASVLALLEAQGRELISEADAIAHISATLATAEQAKISARSGGYTATFDGDERGALTLEVDRDGNVTGSGTGFVSGAFVVEGTMDDGGDFTVENSADGVTFTGSVAADMSLAGIWSNTDAGTAGTFSGELEGRDGQWIGSYVSADGLFNVSVFADGRVAATYAATRYTTPVTLSLSAGGTVTADGQLTLTGSENSARFEGVIHVPGGVVSGTWTWTDPGVLFASRTELLTAVGTR